MEFGSLVLLLIIGFVFYKIFSSSGKKSSKPRSHTRREMRRSAPMRSRQQESSQSVVRNAQRQATRGNFDEAASLFLRAGQVFKAAKMKILKGPQFAAETLELIRTNSPLKFDLILDNLVNECYNRINKPVLAVALLRQAGYHERAEAIEVVAGISSPVSSSQPVETKSAAVTQPVTEVKQKNVKFDIDSVSPVDSEDLDDFLDGVHSIDKKSSDSINEPALNISNALHLAAADLNDKCMVCKNQIKSGDPFIYCVKCGKPGHYRDFGEMMKVSGKCPNCKQRVVISMYDI